MFPLQIEDREYRFRAIEITVNAYRINIWRKKKREGELASFEDNEISRSYFVEVKKGEDGKWKHCIK